MSDRRKAAVPCSWKIRDRDPEETRGIGFSNPSSPPRDMAPALDLATVHSIVEANGGRIEVVDGEPMGGARFVIELQWQNARLAENHGLRKYEAGSEYNGRYRILVVDDEESMREFLSIMLHREGYRVDTRPMAPRPSAASDHRLRPDHQRHQDAADGRAGAAGPGQGAHSRNRGDHDHRLFLHRGGGRGHETGGLRLYHQAVQERRDPPDRQKRPGAQDLRQENRALKKELGKRYSFAGLVGKSKACRRSTT